MIPQIHEGNLPLCECDLNDKLVITSRHIKLDYNHPNPDKSVYHLQTTFLVWQLKITCKTVLNVWFNYKIQRKLVDP